MVLRHIFPHPLLCFQTYGCDNTKHCHIHEPETFRKTSDTSAERLAPSDVISAQNLTEHRSRSWKWAGGWGTMEPRPEAWGSYDPGCRCLCWLCQGCCLNVLSFLIYLFQTRSFQTLCLLCGDTDFYQNFQLDRLTPEKVNGNVSKALTTLGLRQCLVHSLLIFHESLPLFVQDCVSADKMPSLGWRTKRLNTTSHPMPTTTKFQLSKLNWESKTAVFYVRGILCIEFIF